MFETLPIANRGEIAVRRIRNCGRLGVRAIAACSEPDPQRHISHWPMRVPDEVETEEEDA